MKQMKLVCDMCHQEEIPDCKKRTEAVDIIKAHDLGRNELLVAFNLVYGKTCKYKDTKRLHSFSYNREFEEYIDNINMEMCNLEKEVKIKSDKEEELKLKLEELMKELLETENKKNKLTDEVNKNKKDIEDTTGLNNEIWR